MRVSKILPLVLIVLLVAAVPAFGQQVNAPDAPRQGDSPEPVAAQTGVDAEAPANVGGTDQSSEEAPQQTATATGQQEQTQDQTPADAEQPKTQQRVRTRSELRVGEYAEDCPGEGDRDRTRDRLELRTCDETPSVEPTDSVEPTGSIEPSATPDASGTADASVSSVTTVKALVARVQAGFLAWVRRMAASFAELFV